MRPGVIKRKLSFGTQSTDGSRFIERMLTVFETPRRQGRSVLDFLVESLRARRTGQMPPTLFPAWPPERLRPGRSLWPFVSLKQNPSPGLFAGASFTTGNAFEKMFTLLKNQFDSVFFGRHDKIEKSS